MDDLKNKYLSLIADAADEAAIEDLRVQAVGKKGEISLKMRFIGSLASFHDCGSGPGIELILRRCWLFTWFHAGFCQRTNSNIKFRLESTPVINEILADAVDQPTGFCCLDHER